MNSNHFWLLNKNTVRQRNNKKHQINWETTQTNITNHRDTRLP